MANPLMVKGNKLAVGNKGGGRYSVADEALKNRVKHKAWKMKEDNMNDNEAIQIVTKDMTVKADIMSGGKRIGGVDLEEVIKYVEHKTDESLRQNKEVGKEDKDNTGGDISEQDL